MQKGRPGEPERPFHCRAEGGMTLSADLRGGCAHQISHVRHWTMRHQTTSFQLVEHCFANGAFAPEFKKLRVGSDELLKHGRDLLAPFAAVEDAVVTDILGQQIFLCRAWQLARDL